ncbi:Trehalose synthase [uncultured archaeon]|nr:Trehalose synthase [uncultured archaeon]
MKIAFINDTFLQGRGADVVMYELAKRLGKKHEVFILAGETNIPEKNFKFVKLNLQKLFTGKVTDFGYFKKMRILQDQFKELDKRFSFDKVLVFHGGLSSAFRKNEKINYIWLGSPPTKNIFRKLASKYFQRGMRENKIITISNYLAGELKNMGARKVKVILLGVSEEFKPIKKDGAYMLYVGRLEKHKRVDQLIKLSKKINFPLRIIGYGLEEKKLKSLTERINAPVGFLGRVSREDLVRNYQSCSFFVSASEWEGFGLIFVEAGACGKPSIGYNKGSIPEVIINNKTGFVVNNFEEFVEKATLLKMDKTRRKKMGDGARKYSVKFDWERVSKEYERELK